MINIANKTADKKIQTRQICADFGWKFTTLTHYESFSPKIAILYLCGGIMVEIQFMSHFWPRVIITSLLPLTKMDFYNILVLTIFSCVVQSTMSQRFGHKYHFLSNISMRLCWELEGIMKLSFVELQITDCLQFFNLLLMSERSLRYKVYAVKVASWAIYIMHIVYIVNILYILSRDWYTDFSHCT